MRRRALLCALLLSATAAPAADSPVPADELIGAGDGAWCGDLLCFKTISETNNQVHLVRYHYGKFETLFVQSTPTVKAPICLSNGVIAVSTDGIVRKFDLKGDLVFSSKPKGLGGLAKESGRVDSNRIFISETAWDGPEKARQFHLLVLDVSGREPVVKSKFDITQPYRVVVSGFDLVVIGYTNTQRFRIIDTGPSPSLGERGRSSLRPGFSTPRPGESPAPTPTHRSLQ